MLRVIVPLLVGWYIMHREGCPVQTNDLTPNAIRQAVWPILLIAMGLAWNIAYLHGAPLLTDGLYLVSLACFCWWLSVQICVQDEHKAKIVLLLNATLVGLLTYQTAKVSIFASMMLTIVLIWLLFAEQLQLPSFSFSLPKISIQPPKLTIR